MNSIQLDHCWVLYFNKIACLYFFLEDFCPSLIAVIQNILISNKFYLENPSLLWEICVLSGSLLEIWQNWNVCNIVYYHYYFRTHLIPLLLLLLFVIIYNSILSSTKQKDVEIVCLTMEI